jgi:hypothetical protein
MVTAFGTLKKIAVIAEIALIYSIQGAFPPQFWPRILKDVTDVNKDDKSRFQYVYYTSI